MGFLIPRGFKSIIGKEGGEGSSSSINTMICVQSCNLAHGDRMIVLWQSDEWISSLKKTCISNQRESCFSDFMSFSFQLKAAF